MPNMRTVSVINLKGGVGKTTTAVNMAAILADFYGLRVLLIDNDKQGNASQFFDLGNDYVTKGTAEIIGGSNDVLKKSVAYPNNGAVDIVGADMSLQAAENILMFSQERQDNKIMEYFRESGAYENYDYCIIDNPPNLSICTINSLCASDDVIIPVKIDDWALNGVEVITGQIEELKRLNAGLNIAGILITSYKKTAVTEAALDWIRMCCSYNVFDTVIRYSPKVTESTFERVPIHIYSSRSAAAVTYKKFMAEYLGLAEAAV